MSKAWVVSAAGRMSWITGIALWCAYLLHSHGSSYLLDFHVHAAGAWDLLDGTLYRAELVHPGALPVDRFNYPPLAAAIAVPFAWLPDQVGGTAWVILNLAAMAGACVLATRLLGVAPGWAGIGFGLYAIYPGALSALYGNINPLLLFLVLLVAELHLRGKQVASGIFLGIAVGLKLWPITLLPLLLRERRWSAMAWLAGLLVLQAGVTVFLLGADVIPHLVANLTYPLPLRSQDFVIGPSALEWWPRWGSYLLAALLLLVPARGRMGIGLAMLAGMALVPNLWRHYLPTVGAAGLLILADVYRARRRGQHAADAIDGPHAVGEPKPPSRRWPPSALTIARDSRMVHAMTPGTDRAFTEAGGRVMMVLPTYNEALNLPLLIPRILAIRDDVDVLVVDDGSPDGTGQLAEDIGRRFATRVKVLHRASKSGRGGAVMAGFRQAMADDRYEWFGEMDADQSHQPEELPAFLVAIRDADLVVGARDVPGGRIEGWGLGRRVWSRTSNAIIRRVLGVPLTDFTNGYRVYSRRAVEHLASAELRETGFISLSEWAFVLHKAGMRMTQVPTVFINRRLGKSNMSASEAIGALRALLRMRGRLPRRMT